MEKHRAEAWTCHIVLQVGGVRIWRLTASLPHGDKNDPRGLERLEEHRHTLTQEGPEVVRCVQGGVEHQEGEHPHVRGALTQRPQR